jgi:hypothetical protein
MIVVNIVRDTNADMTMDTGSGTARRRTVTITQIIFQTVMTPTALEFTMGSMLDTTPATGRDSGGATITGGGNSFVRHAKLAPRVDTSDEQSGNALICN